MAIDAEKIRQDFVEKSKAHSEQSEVVITLRNEAKQLRLKLKENKETDGEISVRDSLTIQISELASKLRIERAKLTMALAQKEMAKAVAIDNGITTPRGTAKVVAKDSEEIKSIKAEIEEIKSEIESRTETANNRLKEARKLYNSVKESVANEMLSISVEKEKIVSLKNKMHDLEPKRYRKVLTKEERLKRRKAKKVTGNKKRGRPSQFAGKVIIISDEWAGRMDTPCRSGSKSEKAFRTVQDAGSEGIAYESFINNGGSARDIAMQVSRGNFLIKE